MKTHHKVLIAGIIGIGIICAAWSMVNAVSLFDTSAKYAARSSQTGWDDHVAAGKTGIVAILGVFLAIGCIVATVLVTRAIVNADRREKEVEQAKGPRINLPIGKDGWPKIE